MHLPSGSKTPKAKINIFALSSLCFQPTSCSPYSSISLSASPERVWFTAVGVFTGVFFFGFLINGAMYLARVDTLQKDTGPLNARAKLKDLEWEAKRKEKAEAKAKEIDIGGGFKPKGKLPNCPGEHGLTPCLADDVRCDACGADIPDNASIHSCEECDYDLCDGCGAGAAETRGAGAQA